MESHHLDRYDRAKSASDVRTRVGDVMDMKLNSVLNPTAVFEGYANIAPTERVQDGRN